MIEHDAALGYFDADFDALAVRYLDGSAAPEEVECLESQLAAEPTLRERFATLCVVVAGLDEVFALPPLSSAAATEPAIEVQPAEGHSPVLGFLGETWHGTIGFFAQEIPFSLLVASVVTGLGLLASSLVYVTHRQQLADNMPIPAPYVTRSDIKFVGQVTGMADVKWSDDQTATVHGANVSLGRKYAMASGLMEITYDTGAKVILQGPVTYEVDSLAGGFLSVGKVTARVEKKAEESNRPSLIPNPSPLFTIKTPTAVVTDLGTEFGVEVTKEGTTTSHVFRGKVRMRTATDDGSNSGDDMVLLQNESARVVRDSKSDKNANLILSRIAVDPRVFARQVIQLPKTIDLLDIVAGGFGLGRQREHGIDPTSGLEDPLFWPNYRPADRKYHRVDWKSKMIDGVFAPDGGVGPVVIDSAGHAFKGFPKTNGMVYGSIWARSARLTSAMGHSEDYGWGIYAMGEGGLFMPERRGLLCMHANAGITFDMDVMRKHYPLVRLTRFRAMAGVGDASRFYKPTDAANRQLVDLWIVVDGQLKWSRKQLRPKDGAVSIDVIIGDADQFLTLVVTDGGNSTSLDWAVLGDPVLDLAPRTDLEEASAR